MDFFDFLKQESETFQSRILWVFAISGVINFSIIAIIIFSISQTDGNQLRNLFFFCVAMVIFVRAQQYSMTESSRIVEGVVTRIRNRLVDKIRRSSLTAFETMGESRLLTLLTQETMTISEAARYLSRLCTTGALMIVGCVFIAWINLAAVVVVLLLIGTGVLMYSQKRGQFERELKQASDSERDYFTKVNHIIDGFKEVKINRDRNEDLYENHIVQMARHTERLKIQTAQLSANSIIFAQVFCYFIMAFMIFGFPHIVPLEQNALVQMVGVILFLTTGPLQETVSFFPFIERANVAVRNLRELEDHLEENNPDTFPPISPNTKPFQSLTCAGLEYEYHNSNREIPFRIGPIDFELKQGEIVFIMGGNGAGKSTFFKVLTGLYASDQGAIRLNGRRIGPSQMPMYRQYFSIIFQDTHLFDRLYGIPEIDHQRLHTLLRTMQLQDKVLVSPEGEFSNLTLSTGQRKRLALVVAEMEDRDIFVFDEWAADQDPKFRRFFYEDYLPQCQQRGKTVLAITHDDQYYGVADRVYKMEYGILKPYSLSNQ